MATSEEGMDRDREPVMDSLMQIEDQHILLDKLSHEIATGTVKCVMVQIIYEDGASYSLNSGGASAVEQVGLLESMKYDVLMATRSVAETWKEENNDGESD